MPTPFDKSFSKNTILTKLKGRWECECKKGLWSVSAPTKKEANKVGRHYFQQYLFDGEYDDQKA